MRFIPPLQGSKIFSSQIAWGVAPSCLISPLRGFRRRRRDREEGEERRAREDLRLSHERERGGEEERHRDVGDEAEHADEFVAPAVADERDVEEAREDDSES